MSQISLKSISGITSITTPAGVDNQLTLHTNNTSQAFKLDQAGNIHINNHLNTTGVSTSSNFKTGSSNLHSTGLNVGNSFVHTTGIEIAGVNVNGADTTIGLGATIYNSGAAVFTGVVTATQFKGDGSQLSGLARREFYGCKAVNEDLVLIHTNNTSQAFKLDLAGNIHINNHINITGISSASNFKTGSSNLHSTGINLGTGITFSNIGNATFSGIVTASQFKGDGSELTGVASRDFYGFEVTNENLFVKFTNGGADNISLSENASFVEDFIGPTGYTFSINNAGELEMTI